MLVEEDLTHAIRGAAIEVHRNLGPGLLESAYETCLCWELDQLGVPNQKQLALPVNYKGQQLDCDYRIDILVDERVLLELKSVKKNLPIHEAQILTYLRLSGTKVGLLMNFNVPLMKDGIERFVQ